MFKSHLTTAIRNLWRNKGFSALNIIGLAAGLAVCLLIVLYVTDESGYDKYNTQADRIYRLDADVFYNNRAFIAPLSPKPLAPTLVRDYPDIEQMTRLDYQGDILVKKGNQNIQDHHAAFADSTFFKVFTVPMLTGDPNTALDDPSSIVIDETTARRYFNSTDVVGKTIYVDNSTNCKITGVIKDIPRQSHFHFSFIRPLHDSYKDQSNDWLSSNVHSYILIKPGVPLATIQSHINKTLNTYLSKQMEEMFHTSTREIEQGGGHFRYSLMPLTSIHLHSDKSFEIEANGNISYIYIFSVIAALILLIACVNFMNLSTARSSNRAREVGIRKVVGSLRSHLVMQFLLESMLLSFVSLLLAISVAGLLLPLFNQLAGKQIPIDAFLGSWLLPASLLLAIVVGFLAGSYPAFYLSSFQPIRVLKGKIAAGFKGSWLRNSLVTFQFSISIVLIIGTIVIYNQLAYIHNRALGYNRDQVLVLHNTDPLGERNKVLRQNLLQLPGVKNATITSDLPTVGMGSINQNGWFTDPSMDVKKSVLLTDFDVDEHYIPTLGMQITKGRNFSKDFGSDSSGVILNEAAVRLLGVKDPFNIHLYRPGIWSGDPSNVTKVYHLVGIVKDFTYSSMHQKVGPLVMEYNKSWGSIAISVSTHNISALIDQIKVQWKNMNPEMSFSYTFMDNDFDNMYTAEQQTGRLFIAFAVFAILIACLGLFGLVTYAAEQRIKEIGIRKVLGAKVISIVAMLSRDFARLVLIASLISFPIAWWAMNKWLQSFAYRVDIGWWVFVAAGIAAMVIALLTVSLQTIRAALANPAKSLKSE